MFINSSLNRYFLNQPILYLKSKFCFLHKTRGGPTPFVEFLLSLFSTTRPYIFYSRNVTFHPLNHSCWLMDKLNYHPALLWVDPFCVRGSFDLSIVHSSKLMDKPDKINRIVMFGLDNKLSVDETGEYGTNFGIVICRKIDDIIRVTILGYFMLRT